MSWVGRFVAARSLLVVRLQKHPECPQEAPEASEASQRVPEAFPETAKRGHLGPPKAFWLPTLPGVSWRYPGIILNYIIHIY